MSSTFGSEFIDVEQSIYLIASLRYKLRMRSVLGKELRVLKGGATNLYSVRNTHKYGLEISIIVKQTIQFDLDTSTGYWQKSIEK